MQLMKEGDKWQLFVPSELACPSKRFLPPQRMTEGWRLIQESR